MGSRTGLRERLLRLAAQDIDPELVLQAIEGRDLETQMYVRGEVRHRAEVPFDADLAAEATGAVAWPEGAGAGLPSRPGWGPQD